MTGKKLHIAAIVFALTTGCGSPGSRSQLSSVHPPPKFSAATDAVTSHVDGWLEDFQDKRLTALVAEAQENNLDLQVSAARLMAAMGTVRVQNAGRLPTVNADLGGARNKRVNTQGFRLTNPKLDTFDIGMRFAWELDLWGKLANRGRAAYADAEAAQEDFNAAQFSLAGTVAKSWFRLIEADLQLRLAESAHASFQTNLTVVEEGFERGIRQALDVRLTRANVASAEAMLRARKRERDVAARLLEVLLGRYPKDEISVAPELPKSTRPIPAGLPSEIIARRPDLLAAERRLASADERLSAAKKDLLPTISLTASGGTSSAALEDLIDPDQNVWRLAANLVQPLFRGGALRGARARSKAQLLEQVATYSQSILLAFQDVENSLANETHFKAQESALKVAAEESIAAEELAWERYDRGLAGIVTLLDSQRRSVNARSSLHAVTRARLQNRVDLYLALGGDFNTPAPNEHSSDE
ncbi:MAG: transporter [Verrucomicrobiales bacterium]|nr:transporter [Verrucomicrobiales bacterium]|tara:strand:- start:4877 stop:6292 length:1416 start_codon:yes stop_codon:yes gene_type:complete